MLPNCIYFGFVYYKYVRLSLGANIVALTLSEKVTLGVPIFLFEFENSETKVKYYCIAADTSSYTNRYNKFTITVKTSPNTLIGEINLPLGDDYKYTVYEQVSTTNLDPDNTTSIVETGIMTYDKLLDDRTEYSNETTRTVWQG